MYPGELEREGEMRRAAAACQRAVECGASYLFITVYGISWRIRGMVEVSVAGTPVLGWRSTVSFLGVVGLSSA